LDFTTVPKKIKPCLNSTKINFYYVKPSNCLEMRNKSSTFLSGYCTPQEGYIEPFIPAASCGVFWKVLDK